jgi:phenylacetate-coenzyme A ligase PaaK-like adenylate-forming protein
MSDRFGRRIPNRRISGDEQQERMVHRLIRYIREDVYTYSPFHRRRFKELGIDPRELRLPEDIRGISITTKGELAEHSESMILQPSGPWSGAQHDVETIAAGPPTRI